ncbi:hypothetical protein [Helicobacter pylori]|uniref:hypothetical protein n=1 Tax=Helicobacter pylori TaxID=210 RepID=UPI0012E9597D|nr:hypothetical protein [Helicobacter pylori]MUU42771.1 hypothetical protein [Helicobacter pylori]WQV76166.1 hypothetical protein KVM73_00160 [Helicobacter pylori]
MLLNYDFLEFENGKTENRTRDYSLTKAIDKELEAKRLAKSTRPKVKVKEGLSLRATLDAFGDELSRLKREQNTKTIKGSTLEATSLGNILKKIKSGLPFGTISATRHFKDAFIKDFNADQRVLLMSAYKSGLTPSKNDKITKLYLAQAKENAKHPIKVKDFFMPQGKVIPEYATLVGEIYEILVRVLGESYVDKFIDSKATMRDFMSSDKFVKKYRFTQKDNIKRTQELKSLLDKKRHFLGYVQVIGYWKENTNDAMLPDKEVSFFVFSHEPSNTFDLASELLLLGRHFDQEAICYCENAIVLENDRYQVELVSTLPNDFGDVWATFDSITFSTPSELPNALTRLKDQVYTFFKKNPEKDKYGVTFEDLVVKSKITAMKLPINFDERLGVADFVKSSIRARQNCSRTNGYQNSFFADEIENWERKAIFDREKLKCITSKSYRQSYNHNIKVHKVVNAMLKGKKVSRTLIAKVLANTIDTDAGYCFISPTDLATQLNNISPRLSKSIVTAIEQAEGVRLLYALIDRVTYNSLHNTLNFIFDIENPMSDQAFNELVVEVPREALKNVKLPQIKNVLTSQIFDGTYQFRGNDYSFKG